MTTCNTLLSYSEEWQLGERHGARVCWSDDGKLQLRVDEFSRGSGIMAEFRGGRLARTVTLVKGLMHGDEIVYSLSSESSLSSSTSAFLPTLERSSIEAATSLSDEVGHSSASAASHPVAGSGLVAHGEIASIFRYVDGRLEGRCEKFGPGARVQVSHWHGGCLHGESAMYLGGTVIERAEYRHGYPISADAEAKSEDNGTRAAAADDMRLAELQMAAWEAECQARASAAAAAAAAADARTAASSVVADMLLVALLQSEEAAAFAKAAEVEAAAAAHHESAVCDTASSIAAELVDRVMTLAATRLFGL
jgi:hypothetical protein